MRQYPSNTSCQKCARDCSHIFLHDSCTVILSVMYAASTMSDGSPLRSLERQPTNDPNVFVAVTRSETPPYAASR